MSQSDDGTSGTPAVVQPLYKAILDAAMDAFITIDQTGQVLEWNISAELMFGYRADEAIGRDLGELIVPASTRSLHWAGVQRLAGGGAPSILDRRVEVVGQRADGTQFPVELTITRVLSGGGVVYSGFVRDITDRRQMLHDLKMSRSRLITISDEARKRVERDLHDGAQQQLVALAIGLSAAKELIDSDPQAAARTLDAASDVLSAAIRELRDLASGIHSSILTEHGLPAALQELGRRSAIPVHIDVDIPRRIAEHAETTTYYFAAESMTNAAKHGAGQVNLSARLVASPVPRLGVDNHQMLLECTVSDDGPGGADAAKGSGLRGLADRLAAVEGTLRIDSRPGRGTTLTASVPVNFSSAAAS